MKFLNNLNMSQNEIQNAVIQNLADAPSNPRAGQLYWDTTDNKLYIYDGTKWGATGGDDKMDKVNPTGTGYFSLNRKADTTIGEYSFAEGYNTTSSAYTSHAEGYNTTASGYASHAEGDSTTASKQGSHAEGANTQATGSYSHAEGALSRATGEGAHAEGQSTTASGSYSHAEGANTKATGSYSHVEGQRTTASGFCSHVFGKFNIEDTNSTYVEIVGNGAMGDLSNARTLDWNGNEILAGTSTATEFIRSGTGETLLSVLNTDGTTDYMLSYKDSTLEVGNLGKAIKLLGNATRPKYETSTTAEGGVDLALYSDTTDKLTASNIKAGANINVTSSGNDVTIKAVDVATLGTDGKVPLSQLPDAVLGQLVYGGNVTTNAVATLTDNAKKKLGTTSATITLTNNTTAITGYKANEGIYYIATTGFTFAGITFESGDWLISTGSAWTKIDTSDAVNGVKGDKETTYRTGNVNITPDNIGAEPSDSARLLTEWTYTSFGNIPAETASYIVTSSTTVYYAKTSASKGATLTLEKGSLVIVTELGSYGDAAGTTFTTRPNMIVIYDNYGATLLHCNTWWSEDNFNFEHLPAPYGLKVNGYEISDIYSVGHRPILYVPTDAGTKGQILTSSGTGEPIWKTLTLLSKATVTNDALTPSGGVCTWSITNSIGSADVSVDIYEVSTNEKVLANVVVTSSTITVSIASTANITAGTYKAVIIG